MRKPYPSDMTDEQWAVAETLIPESRLGRPREVVRGMPETGPDAVPRRPEAVSALVGDCWHVR